MTSGAGCRKKASDRLCLRRWGRGIDCRQTWAEEASASRRCRWGECCCACVAGTWRSLGARLAICTAPTPRSPLHSPSIAIIAVDSLQPCIPAVTLTTSDPVVVLLLCLCHDHFFFIHCGMRCWRLCQWRHARISPSETVRCQAHYWHPGCESSQHSPGWRWHRRRKLFIALPTCSSWQQTWPPAAPDKQGRLNAATTWRHPRMTIRHLRPRRLGSGVDCYHLHHGGLSGR